MSDFLTTPAFPYCKGCGHHLIARNTVKALESLNLRPLDLVLVTDIGCHGILDRCFATHTVHGLHGRSVALGAGIAMGLPAHSGKRVLVFIGDGGATIGLQHLLEAARLNLDLTVVVHNNMLYGMTGGQPSGLTPCGFRTAITPQGSTLPHHDLCRLVHDAGAPYTSRVLAQGDFSATLHQALEVEGFALVEVLELCPSHALKLNPDLRLREFAHQTGYEPGTWHGETRSPFRLIRHEESLSLLEGIEEVPIRFTSTLEGTMSVLLTGSAGEGVQRAAGIFAQAAMSCGLHVTKKGSYPVTVGVGFSTAEIVFSQGPIAYHGIAAPDAVIVTSVDGLRHNSDRIRGMKGGIIWLDAGLEVPQTGAELRVRDFRGQAGARQAAMLGLQCFVQEAGVMPFEALSEALQAGSTGNSEAASPLLFVS